MESLILSPPISWFYLSPWCLIHKICQGSTGSTKLTRFLSLLDFLASVLCSWTQWHSRQDLICIMLLFPRPSYHQTWPPGSLRTGRVVHSTGRMAASWTLWCYLPWPQLQVLPWSPLSYGWTSPSLNSGAISALTFLHGCETLRVADIRACLPPARWICWGSCRIFVPTLGVKRKGNSKRSKESCDKNVARDIPSHRSKYPRPPSHASSGSVSSLPMQDPQRPLCAFIQRRADFVQSFPCCVPIV